MKGIIHKKPTFWKYETTASYVVLCFQYLYVLVFGENIDPEVSRQYANLWFYDLVIFFPVLFLLFFPQKFRIIAVSLIFIAGLIYFYRNLGFNSIVFNTFVSIFLANRFLVFNFSEKQHGKLMKFRFLKILILLPIILITVLAENILEYLGITTPEIKGDGKVMTNFGRFLLFGLYYGSLAYFAFREERKVTTDNM
ncbi:hypothetical protein [Chryseobacterium sp. GP-SGM7]|uniref:hypothetical protein n=1 Tax=Chryseobacterium sp. GP-SGM7 TaxID=3411323 RepID=UPI003B9428C0